MKREHLLLIGSVVLAVGISLGLIRWLAPQLLGLRADQVVVQTAKEVPPFFDGVFRRADFESAEFLLQDPNTSVRGHPLLLEGDGLGPHDLLGFRNLSVPNVADVVVIGDSQTYGNNAVLDENWPSRMTTAMPEPRPAVYSMATGSWGAVQYLDMAKYALVLRPRVLVVAYYTGNDSLEAFKLAYNIERWAFLKPDPTLKPADHPPVAFPPPESEWWKVRFPDGVETVFTPRLRLIPNDSSSAAVRAGYAIVRESARLIAEAAQRSNVRVVFTVIPTKELAYAKKIEQAGLTVPEDYRKLLAEETRQVDQLVTAFKALPSATYADSIGPLQQATLRPTELYPRDINGHPVAAGYDVIGKALAAQVSALLPKPVLGPVFVPVGPNAFKLHLATREGVWLVLSPEVLEGNGWEGGELPTVGARDLATRRPLGILTERDPKRFGPAAVVPR